MSDLDGDLAWLTHLLGRSSARRQDLLDLAAHNEQGVPVALFMAAADIRPGSHAEAICWRLGPAGCLAAIRAAGEET